MIQIMKKTYFSTLLQNGSLTNTFIENWVIPNIVHSPFKYFSSTILTSLLQVLTTPSTMVPHENLLSYPYQILLFD